jgi:uncharacterized protein (DUF302 family)
VDRSQALRHLRGTDLPFAEAVNRARDLLQEAGYGMLCEIDVKAKPGDS